MFKNKIVLIFASLFIHIFFAACSTDDNVNQPSAASANFTVTIENVSEVFPFIHSGIFNTPVGSNSPGEIFSGDSYEFEFTAGPGMRLSFATMFAQSNDLFYAPDENGIELFDGNGNQITGDITSLIYLWDAGTEVNQEPGSGIDQAPRQSSLNQGSPDPNNLVRIATNDFGNLPSVNEMIKVTLSSTSATGFRLSIENISVSFTLMTSDGNSHPAPIAPGVFVIHSAPQPLFAEGQPANANGLEDLAEDGVITKLMSEADANTGLTSPFAPGVYAVYTGTNPLFINDQADAGEGLEELAEDGIPASLAAALNGKENVNVSGTFTNPIGGSGEAPIFPGESYQFSFSAESGEKLTFATMLVQSNDIFASPSQSGIELFTNGSAINGELTSQLFWWDAGTEINEEPGIGLNQAPRQAGPNTGVDENGVVTLLSNVNDSFIYPAISSTLRVTIQSN